MANTTPNIQNKLTSALHPETQKEALKLLDNAGDKASEIYETGKSWMSRNRSLISYGASILAVGAVGYFVVRSFLRKDSSGFDSKTNVDLF